jgi:hypothetical protein
MTNANRSSSPLVRETAAAFLCRRGAAAWLARVALPEAWEIALTRLGTLELRPGGLDPWETSALLTDVTTACERFSLPAMGPGVLLVERRLARHLVSVLFGLPMPLVVTPLSRIERGVLGGLLGGVLAKLGLASAIRLDPTGADEVGSHAVALTLRARVAGETGEVWLCATPAGIVSFWQGVLRSSGKETLAALQLELGHTSLRRSEALAASEGDVVVFDETDALSSSSDWPLQLHCSGRLVSAAVAQDGRVCAREQTVATEAPSVAVLASPGNREDVVIVAEIAHAAAPAGPVQGPVSSARGDGILLRMEQADWAEGDLCQVAGRMAVRIRRILAG